MSTQNIIEKIITAENPVSVPSQPILVYVPVIPDIWKDNVESSLSNIRDRISLINVTEGEGEASIIQIVAEGKDPNRATGRGASAFGEYTNAIGDKSFIVGTGGWNEGHSAFAFGQACHIGPDGTGALCGGYHSEVTKRFATALGNYVKVYGYYGFGAGLNIIVNSDGAHAFGADLTVTGTHSGAVGKDSQISAINSYTFGAYNYIYENHRGTFLAGEHLRSSRDHQVMFGLANEANPDSVFEIGRGKVDSNGNVKSRRNLFSIDVNGYSKQSGSTYLTLPGNYLVTKDFLVHDEVLFKSIRDERKGIASGKRPTISLENPPDDENNPYDPIILDEMHGNVNGGKYAIHYINSGGVNADKYFKVYIGSKLIYHIGYGTDVTLARDQVFEVDIPYNNREVIFVTNYAARFTVHKVILDPISRMDYAEGTCAELKGLLNDAEERFASSMSELADDFATDLDKVIYEYEHNVEYLDQNESGYLEKPNKVVFDRNLDGKLLDIVSINLSGYVKFGGTNESCYFSQDITRQIQGVPNGEYRSFKVAGICSIIGRDDLSAYDFKLDVHANNGKFAMKAGRVVVGSSFLGRERTTYASLSNVKIRAILARKIKVIGE